MRVFEQYFSIRIVPLCSNCEQTSIFSHILLIADPYSDHKFGLIHATQQSKTLSKM